MVDDVSSTTANVAAEKIPGHWLLAGMGKRVLRPGGLELTRWLLDALNISSEDDVVEFAPGLGVTARLTLARRPRSYTAVERDRDAAATVDSYLSGPNQRCISGSAEATGLPDGSASIVYGEAMLSMQVPAAKARIVGEAARLLRRGGQYGIHELCLVPDEVSEFIRNSIQRELSHDIHVGVRPLTISEWRGTLSSGGFTETAHRIVPMHLLEPRRILKDEGLWGAMRFAVNVATHPTARRRVLSMRRIFRKYSANLAAVAFVARKI
jgi:methyltransferase family protein